ncbi:hypothetical protein CBOM_07793 [Ceraceosorus bombacis]|uniref:Uncharacterized protein n=1 Tax=Ceraceosorus bombacis TaxID=401625 RepID=A0A0P1BN33_9BASI|nr:hypothetical protein CBOM_07793 [Ceraceosorus bombacis]
MLQLSAPKQIGQGDICNTPLRSQLHLDQPQFLSSFARDEVDRHKSQVVSLECGQKVALA